MVSQQLQRNIRQQRKSRFVRVGNIETIVKQSRRNICFFGNDGRQQRVAGFGLLTVGNHFGQGNTRAENRHHRHIFVKQGNRSVFEFAGGITVGVDIADFFQFQSTFQSAGKIDAPSDINHVAEVFQLIGNRFDRRGIAENFFHFGRQFA